MTKEGIVCPTCNVMENYASHNSPMKRAPREIRRKKACKCGQIFETIEVLVGAVEVKTRT